MVNRPHEFELPYRESPSAWLGIAEQTGLTELEILWCMQGRLNNFQKSMLQWNDLHPYNAVHVVRIPGILDLERLKGVITGALEGKGLTGLALNQGAGTYQYRGGAALPEIRMTTAGTASSSSLAEEIEHQLNTPFLQNAPFSPFRFFVIQEAAAFFMGLVYFHAMADAECILFLIKDMIDAYRGGDRSRITNPVDIHPPRLDRLFGHHPGVLARKLASLPSLAKAMRSTCRPPCRDAGGPRA